MSYLTTVMKARQVKPHDHIVGGGTVLWKMGPLVPASRLLPYGGTLIQFTNRTQMGVPNDLELTVYRLPTDDEGEQPCPARDEHRIGCMYRQGHDESMFPHRFR